ncbi:class I SAM-dependent methyltransferase [Burkholderia cepacia]|uniref:class I SAM-dependent methyltransferase n=1 Tax=Burkholderia cepacia TaxID=292 RepID=UPI002FE17001
MDRTPSDDVLSEVGDSDPADYLSRCQVDTPPALVEQVWHLVNERRAAVGRVVDFGCGDARFARGGRFERYTGFEIDPKRLPEVIPPLATVELESAFVAANTRAAFDVCIGNPPYVRHHDLSASWLETAERRLRAIDGYSPDGRSNAYIYFTWLALDAVNDDGLVALVIPYEWISRPASESLRRYLAAKGWRVDVYHLEDARFERVLTTACITIIDKAAPADEGGLHLHEIGRQFDSVRHRLHITGSDQTRLSYERATSTTRASRGLSPGGQEFFVLTEELRLHYRLQVKRDVIPAITSFRHLRSDQRTLTERLFRDEYVNAGRKCWLINPVAAPSPALESYLKTASDEVRGNYTCSKRQTWWRTKVPPPAQILYSSGFKSSTPKMFKNEMGAVHVGAVHGIYCQPKKSADMLLTELLSMDFSKRVVPLSGGFLKIEVNQMNAVLNQLCAAR